MKKRMIAWILALLLLLGLVPAAAQAAENIELTVWAAEIDMDWLYNRLGAFSAANPQWNISWYISECPIGDTANMISAAPAAGADVYFFTNDQLSMLKESGAILPLTAEDAAQALALTSEALMNTVADHNGAYYGIPVSGNTWFMYYDKRIFSEEDVKSLEAMLAKGKVVFPLTNTWYLPAFYFANGGTMFGNTGTNESLGIRFNGTKGAAVTRRLAELVNEPNFLAHITESGGFLLSEGTANAYFSGSWDYPGAYELLGENLGAAQLPTVTIDGQAKQMKSFLGSTAVGVNAYTKHKEASRALAMFLSNEDSQLLRWEMSGVVPSATALADTPSILANAAAKAQMDTQINTSVPQPTVEKMYLYWGPAGQMPQWLLNGEITADNAAERTEEWNAALNGGENPPPFTDVPAGSFYDEPVLWALENSITTGATADTFNPGGQCLRAHVVTFLHRAADNPEPASAKNPFTDVKTSDFFYKPVLWAVENSITNGVSADKFGSYDVCNRAAVVTFLWRAAGSPAPKSANNPFTDVKTTDFFYKPVLWAIENGITNGLTATEFGPNSPCNRAQVVTFLYRAYN